MFAEDYDSPEERRRWRDLDRLAWGAAIALLVGFVAIQLVAEYADAIASWVVERWA